MRVISTFANWIDFCLARKIDAKDHEWVRTFTARIELYKWRDSRKERESSMFKGEGAR